MQAMTLEERLQPMQSVIEEMLVIDRVEFAFRDHVDRVGALENGDTVGLQQPRESSDEVIDPIYVREHIVGDPCVCGFSSCRQLLGELQGKEVVENGNADLACVLGRTGRRVNPQTGNSQ